MPPKSAEDTLKILELTEANLVKAERLLTDLQAVIPEGVVFGSDNGYDDARRRLHEVVSALPAIDGFRPIIETLDLNLIAQWRLDAMEIGEPEAALPLHNALEEPGRVLGEYRYRLQRHRRRLMRNALTALIADVDRLLATVQPSSSDEERRNDASVATLSGLQQSVAQIDTLLGSSVARPPRWPDLRRHLHFGLKGDIDDIQRNDWPTIKPALEASLYGPDEAVPVPVADLSELVSPQPHAPIPTGLQWHRLTAEGFERLVYSLLTGERAYQNVQWLMHTSAADRGRDISATRVSEDSLSGVRHERVIVQCKHWLSQSVGVRELATLKENLKLWEPPRVDVLIIATTGRFAQDAVQAIERHNASDSALKIEPWSGSHLELLLAQRPALIGEFNLRA